MSILDDNTQEYFLVDELLPSTEFELIDLGRLDEMEFENAEDCFDDVNNIRYELTNRRILTKDNNISGNNNSNFKLDFYLINNEENIISPPNSKISLPDEYFKFTNPLCKFLFDNYQFDTKSLVDFIKCVFTETKQLKNYNLVLKKQINSMSLNSVAVEYQKSKNLSENNPNFELYFSIAVAMFLAGGGIGHIIYELVDSKKFSKKNFLVLGSILNLTSFSIIYFYTYYYIIGVARFFMGLNAGFASAIVPGTIYKLAPQKRKGIFGAFYPGFVGLGLLIGQVMTIFKDASMLFIPHITLCVLFFIQTVSLYFIPNMDVEESNEKEKNVFQTLRSKEARRSVILAVIFHLAQHLSGFNYLTLFTDQILADSPNPYFFGIMNFVIALVFTCLSGFLCDLGGRKLMFDFSFYLIILDWDVFHGRFWMKCLQHPS
ncbi:hypothetical protein P3W45_001728 [Vairimorpha bombi]